MAWIKLEQAGNLEAESGHALGAWGTPPSLRGTSQAIGRAGGRAPSLGSSGLKSPSRERRKFAEGPFPLGDSFPNKASHLSKPVLIKRRALASCPKKERKACSPARPGSVPALLRSCAVVFRYNAGRPCR